MQNPKWQSKKIYEHPAEHQKGRMGQIALSQVGVYFLQVGSSHMSCPQDWAAKIHKEEMDWQPVVAMPAELHSAIKLLADKNGQKITWIVKKALEEYLAKNN